MLKPSSGLLKFLLVGFGCGGQESEEGCCLNYRRLWVHPMFWQPHQSSPQGWTPNTSFCGFGGAFLINLPFYINKIIHPAQGCYRENPHLVKNFQWDCLREIEIFLLLKAQSKNTLKKQIGKKSWEILNQLVKNAVLHSSPVPLVLDGDFPVKDWVPREEVLDLQHTVINHNAKAPTKNAVWTGRTYVSFKCQTYKDSCVCCLSWQNSFLSWYN